MSRWFITKKEWGNIRVVDYERVPRMLPGPSGMYDSGEDEDRRWLLRCGCGFEWLVLDSEFRGFNQVKNCGRSECTHLPRGVGRPKGPEREKKPAKFAVTLYLSTKQMAKIATLAEGWNMEIAEAIQSLIETTPKEPDDMWNDGTVGDSDG